MIFALIDYIKYMKFKGSYYIKNEPIMRYGFPNKIPELVINKLKPGDMIFKFTGKSFISWTIMYLTKSKISHVAMYSGTSSIIHATTEGVITEPIESLFGKNSIILPVHLRNISLEKRNKMIKFAEKRIDAPFGWDAIFIKFLRIVSGRDWPYYRLAYFVDFLTILFLLDLIPLLLLKTIIFTWLAIPYLLLLVIGRLLWSKKPLFFDKYYSKPVEIFKFLIHNGADIYANPNGFPNKELLKKILDKKCNEDKIKQEN